MPCEAKAIFEPSGDHEGACASLTSQLSAARGG